MCGCILEVLYNIKYFNTIVWVKCGWKTKYMTVYIFNTGALFDIFHDTHPGVWDAPPPPFLHSTWAPAY